MTDSDAYAHSLVDNLQDLEIEYILAFCKHAREWGLLAGVLIEGWENWTRDKPKAQKFFKKMFPQFKSEGVIDFYNGLQKKRNTLCQ